MTFTIRPGRIEDAYGIALVQVETWKTTYTRIVPDSYLSSLDVGLRAEKWKEQFEFDTALIFVAESLSSIVGFVSGGKLRDAIAGYDAELYAIYVLQAEQRRGLGKMLTQKLVGALHAKGHQSLIVWVLEKNPSVGFYAHLGGSPVAQKQIEIGGAKLTEIAFGWLGLDNLL